MFIPCAHLNCTRRLTVFARQPALAVAHKLFNGYTMMMCVFLWFGNGFLLVESVIIKTYARVPDPSGASATFLINTDYVSDQLYNASTLCAMYPSPANGFCS